MLPFDLHVLSIPPAFNLSHDQTLQFNYSLILNKISIQSWLDNFKRDFPLKTYLLTFF